MIELPLDFRDVLVELVDAGAAFVVIGGYAVAFHGHVRATKDIDILVKPSADNAARVFRALAAFGAPLDAFNVRPEDLAGPGPFLTLGTPPFRIDVLTTIPGVSFDEASENHGVLTVDGRQVSVIGLDALIRNKRASGRPQDIADATILESISAADGR
jgi:predicted nucleotidyltransferase